MISTDGKFTTVECNKLIVDGSVIGQPQVQVVDFSGFTLATNITNVTPTCIDTSKKAIFTIHIADKESQTYQGDDDNAVTPNPSPTFKKTDTVAIEALSNLSSLELSNGTDTITLDFA